MSFYNASCTSCGKRFGWQGDLTDKPPCPRCNYVDDPEELKRVQDELDRIEHELLNPGDCVQIKDGPKGMYMHPSAARADCSVVAVGNKTYNVPNREFYRL